MEWRFCEKMKSNVEIGLEAFDMFVAQSLREGQGAYNKDTNLLFK
jgi:hypothetical protein